MIGLHHFYTPFKTCGPFFFFFLNEETLLKIKTLENFQTKLEGNQVDYTIKPRTLQRR
jgi:hypothetical protein